MKANDIKAVLFRLLSRKNDCSLLSLNNKCTDSDFESYYSNQEKTSEIITENVSVLMDEYCKFCEKTSIHSATYVKKMYQCALSVNGYQNSSQYYRAVNYFWQHEGASDELMELLMRFEKTPDAFNENCDRVWLIYASCLLEKGQIEKCDDCIEKYIDHFGMHHIHQFLPLSAHMCNMGYDDEKIMRSKEVYEHMMYSSKMFVKLVKNMSVAVVGNGPSERGGGNGGYIDSHDIVIRFNDYVTKEFEKDYGTKLDIWARNMVVDGCLPTASKSKLIIFEPNVDRFWIKDSVLASLYEYIFDYNLYVCNLGFRDELSSKIDGFPTTGLLVMYNLYKNRGLVGKVDIFGFTLPDSSCSNISEHYYGAKCNEKYVISSMHHNLKKESQLLQTILDGFEHE